LLEEKARLPCAPFMKATWFCESLQFSITWTWGWAFDGPLSITDLQCMKKTRKRCWQQGGAPRRDVLSVVQAQPAFFFLPSTIFFLNNMQELSYVI